MRALITGLALVLAASACSGEPEREPAPTEIRIATRSLGSLDPLAMSSQGQEALVGRQVFEGLTGYDPKTLEARPALASSWTVEPGARTFTFLLRDGAKFHSGRPVRAADVVWSLNRLARAACVPATSPKAAAPAFLLAPVVGYAEVGGSCESEEMSGLQAVGENTVSISLAEPWADLPSVLAHPAAAVVPQGADGDSFGERPEGSGPYFVSDPWDGSVLRLARFDDHWGRRPPVPTLTFVAAPDAAEAYADLLAGRLHVASVPSGRVRDAQRRFPEGGFGVQTGLGFVGFNLRRESVGALPFRTGLSRAVDRDALADGVHKGTRRPATGLSSPALPGANGETCGDSCRFDLDEARRLIGSAHGPTPPDLVLTTSEDGSNPATARAVADMLGRAGVEVRVDERPFVDHVKGVQAGDADMFLFGWVPAYPTMDGMLFQLFRSRSRDDNVTRYANGDVDALLAQGRTTLEDAERAAVLTRAEERILADMPVIPLGWHLSSVAVDPRLESSSGVLVDGVGLISFKDIGF